MELRGQKKPIAETPQATCLAAMLQQEEASDYAGAGTTREDVDLNLRPEANERKRQVLFAEAEVIEFVPEEYDEADVSDGPEYEATYSRHLRRVCDRVESKQRSSADVSQGMYLGSCIDSAPGTPQEGELKPPRVSEIETPESLRSSVGLGKPVDTTISSK